MKLATWNVHRLTRTTSVRMSRARPYLDAINADIWVLTETGEEVRGGVDEDLVALAHRALVARLRPRALRGGARCPASSCSIHRLRNGAALAE
jgi:hypothetical protein